MSWLKSVAYASFGVGTLVGLIPRVVEALFPSPFGFDTGVVHVAGLILLGLGGWVYFGCVAGFASRGGTPAFWDPPRRLVVNPAFRLVRNPMYVGVTLMVAGRALYAGSPTLVLYALVVYLGFHLFVVLYEEPHLRETFGMRYRAYCERVPRWIPRLPFRRLTSAAIWQNLRS